jgi:GSH-dependent disulfide-bond oxidoreductase
MFPEEVGLEYRFHPVDISAGDQFKQEFLAFSPHNRMPAIIDTDGIDAGEVSSACLPVRAAPTGSFSSKKFRGP